jgi:hypothetical protein
MIVLMNAPTDNSYDTGVLDTLSQNVMVGDGATGTQLQAADLSRDDVDNRRRRGRDEIPSAAIWLTSLTTNIRELALKSTAIAKRVGLSWASKRRVTT